MTTQDARFNSRINRDLKARGDAVLASLGIKPSQALTMFYTQMAERKAFPLELKVPNEDLLEAFEEAKNPENLTSYKNAKDMFDDILKD